MTGWLGGAYLWVKAAHIIFVIFWMAGLFIFPRYLVHHQDELADPEARKRWEHREALLQRMILGPSMGMVWLLGLALAANVGLFDGFAGMGWLHAKLALVVLLSGFQGWLTGYARHLAAGEARLPTRRLRMINELPALGIALIVVLAVVKPF